MIDYAVAGTGRSGTLWTARILTALGGRCGHEQVFNFDRSGTLRRLETTTFKGDSSLAVGAYLDDIGATPVLHVLRDPLDVVNSWYGSGAAAAIVSHPDAPFPNFQRLQIPELTTPGLDPVGVAILWTVLWTERIAAGVRGPYRWRRLEDLGPVEISELCPFLGFVPKPPPATLPDADTNRHERADLTWADIDDHPEGWRLRVHAERYGYL